MTNKELFDSGELELYVAGLLSEERTKEISLLVENNDDIKIEVEQIEAVVMRLAKESTTSSDSDFTEVLKKVVTDRVATDSKVRRIYLQDSKTKKSNFGLWTGWAAAVLLLVFFGLEYQENSDLENNLQISQEEKANLTKRLGEQQTTLVLKENIITSITSENTRVIELAGQKISPTSKVKAFWDSQNKRIVLDTKNLPTPPKGKVYQVWSLKLDPLTPTSLGLLENQNSLNTLFVLENQNQSEGFGITLEPEGGSKVPTLDQLYVLGVVS